MKYIDYYPFVLKEVYEIKLISFIMDKYLLLLESNKDSLKNELYLSTATGIGLEIWEHILGITAPDNDVEVRRFTIRSKLLGDRTSLRTKLNILLGEDNYKIAVDPIKCHITFNLELSVQSLKNAVVEMLEKVLPMNLTYEISYAYNKHSDLRAYKHQDLKEYTHKELNAKKLR